MGDDGEVGDLDRAPPRVSLGGMGHLPSSPRGLDRSSRRRLFCSSSPELDLQPFAESIHRSWNQRWGPGEAQCAGAGAMSVPLNLPESDRRPRVMPDHYGNICSVSAEPPSAGTSIAAPSAASFRGRGAASPGWMATARSDSQLRKLPEHGWSPAAV